MRKTFSCSSRSTDHLLIISSSCRKVRVGTPAVAGAVPEAGVVATVVAVVAAVVVEAADVPGRVNPVEGAAADVVAGPPKLNEGAAVVVVVAVKDGAAAVADVVAGAGADVVEANWNPVVAGAGAVEVNPKLTVG